MNNVDVRFLEVLDSNGNDILCNLPTDETCQIRDGKLYLSSYHGGIVEWNEEEKSYIHCYYGRETKVDIKSFKYSK